jgi:WD40 repeat protein
MASPTTKPKETSTITPHQKFQGHTRTIWGAIHLPDGQRIITCSGDGSLRVWNVKSGKQIGEDWRVEQDWSDRDWEKEGVHSIALSPDERKVGSGSGDGVVRLWDIDTGKVIAKWTGHTRRVRSVCWSQDDRRLLSGSFDGTARQWDVESGETILKPIETGHTNVFAVIYSPADTTLIATGGFDDSRNGEPMESPVKIWDTKTGKLVAALKGHTWTVNCLAWTKDGKTLISGSADCSIRIWNTTKWEQIAVLVEHIPNFLVRAIAISPNDCILASASDDGTVRLWNIDNGQPISSRLEHKRGMTCVSFSADRKLLATGGYNAIAYTWDVAAIIKKAGLNDSLSNSTVS